MPATLSILRHGVSALIIGCALTGLGAGAGTARADVVEVGGIEVGTQRPLKASGREEAIRVAAREAARRIWEEANPGAPVPKLSDAQLERAVRWTEFDSEKARMSHYLATVRVGIDSRVLGGTAAFRGTTASGSGQVDAAAGTPSLPVPNLPDSLLPAGSASTPSTAPTGVSSAVPAVGAPQGRLGWDVEAVGAGGDFSVPLPSWVLVLPVRSAGGGLLPFPDGDDWLRAWTAGTAPGSVPDLMTLDGSGSDREAVSAGDLATDPDGVAERLMERYNAPAVALVTVRTGSGGFKAGETAGVAVSYRRKGEETLIQALEMTVGPDGGAGVKTAAEQVLRAIARGAAGTGISAAPEAESARNAGSGAVQVPDGRTGPADGGFEMPYVVEVTVAIHSLEAWVRTKAALERLPAQVELRTLSRHEARAVVRHGFADPSALRDALVRAGVLR